MHCGRSLACGAIARSGNTTRGKSGLIAEEMPWEVHLCTQSRAVKADGKCRRNYTALSSDRVRVKTCGKSARAFPVMGVWGKPHFEQDKIGKVVCSATNTLRVCRTDRWLPLSLLSTESGLQACPSAPDQIWSTFI